MKLMLRATHRSARLALTLTLLCCIASPQPSHANFGILRSTDDGKSWKQVFRGDFDVDHLAIDEDGRILASTMIVTPHRIFSELYASLAGSDSWNKLTPPGIGPKGGLILDLLATPDGSVFALLQRRILRTDDGGTTWTVVPSTPPAIPRSLKLGPDNSLLGFTDAGLYQSTDKGKSWHSIGFEDQRLDGGLTLSDGTILVTFQCKLFAASVPQDRSFEWSVPEDACPNSDQFASDTQGLLFANTPGGVLKSDATGKTWKKVLAFKNEVVPLGIAVAPGGEVLAVVLKEASSPTLFRSTDNGETWQMVQELGPGITVSQFAFAPNGTVYAGLTSLGD